MLSAAQLLAPLRTRVDAMSKRWDALDARVQAVVDRRPSLWWAVATGCTGVLLALPGTLLGWYVNGALTPGTAGQYVLLIGAVPMLFALGLVVAVGAILAGLPQRWFGLGRVRSRLVTAALVGCAMLPWAIPGGPLLGRAGQARGWALVFAAAGCLVLPAAALLVPGGRRLRAIGAVCLLVTGSLWLTARQERLATETAVALRELGSPPRDLVRLLRWDGVAPVVLTRGGRGSLAVEYDEITPLPVPDGSEIGVLDISRWPIAGDAAPCTAGRGAALRVASDASDTPDPSSTCRSVGPQEWQVGTRTVVLRSGPLLLTFVAEGEASDFASPGVLRAVLRTQHIADDAELRQLSFA